MAKLSAAQDKAIGALNNGEFPLGTNKRTIDALVNNGYVTEDNTFYELTEKGLQYLGTDTTVEEITAELNTNPWETPLADWERELLYGNHATPFVVQHLFGNIWTRVGRAAATWGTANVWRNRLLAKGLTVRVHNTTTDQVWV